MKDKRFLLGQFLHSVSKQEREQTAHIHSALTNKQNATEEYYLEKKKRKNLQTNLNTT